MENAESNIDFRAIYRKLATEKDLDGVDLRVFLYLFARLDFHNFIRVEQLEIADALERRREHISRAISKLKKKAIIIEASPRIGRSSAYILNSKYGK